jgi:1,4-alpha-glucan branching enzyme
MENRKDYNALDKPYSVYEVHLGSWKRHEEDNRFLTYLEFAEDLVAYVKETGFTHVEFMPIWNTLMILRGVSVSRLFCTDSRFGNPQEFMVLVDRLHQAGIGVILDWVPSHFR